MRFLASISLVAAAYTLDPPTLHWVLGGAVVVILVDAALRLL